MVASSDVFHRPVPVRDLPAAGRPFRITARAEECRDLARRYGLLAIDSLTAEGLLRPEASGRRVRLEGRLVADVVQTCVISLDPVPAHIDVGFQRLFGWDVNDEWEEGTGEEIYLDLASELPAERLSSDVLDLGEAVAEQLSLELDPYPRKPGALFTGCDSDESGETTGSARSLAALSQWRNRDQTDDEG